MTQPILGDGVTDPLVSGQGESGSGEPAVGTDPSTGAQSGAVVPEATVSQAAYDALMKRMQAADQNRTRVETELNQLRTKDLPEAERLKADLQAATESAEKATAALSETLIANAFLKHSDVEWHNRDRALALLDMSKVHIDLETREVTGLKDAIEALKKSDPYLVKPPAEGTPAAPAGPPGTLPANNGGSGSGKPDPKQMTGRFGALRGRV